MEPTARCEANGSTRRFALYNKPAIPASAEDAANSGKDDVMPKKRIWRRKVKVDLWPCADGKSWSWSIMASAFYMECGPRRNPETEEEAKTDVKFVCDNMGLTITEWQTLKN